MNTPSLSRRSFLGGACAAGGALCLNLPRSAPAAAPAVPLLALWKKQMAQFGHKHGEFILDPTTSTDMRLGATYYDAIRVYYQIADYTKDKSWLKYVKGALKGYRDDYVLKNDGKIPGYWIFPHGLATDWKRNKDKKSSEALIALSKKASYAADTTPAGWTVSSEKSREVAYVLNTLLLAEEVGEDRQKRVELLVGQALGHYDQWFVSKKAPYVRPFMAALTAEALIGYAQKKGKKEEIQKAIKGGMDWLWKNMWVASAGAFKYTDRKTSTGGTNPAPDLNLLIAPVYAWLYHQTGEAKYRTQADHIFAGGVRKAFLSSPKQFNQNYRWSFDYLRWRQAPAGTS
jgi:hypothetical protein